MKIAQSEIQSADCSICRHLAKESLFEIKAFSDSVLYLNEDQFFKGYCILEYRVHVKELFDLSDKERDLYIRHLSIAARAIQRVLCPDKMNYELLGNKVPHLHWHLIPRFKDDFAWSDPIWSRAHLPLQLPEQESNHIISEIRKNL
jgi:diadenosine tetraphosphate (Ap4A) HIT family hydrolase